MKRAARVLPSIAPPLRPTPHLLRPSVLLPSRPLAGPSSSPLPVPLTLTAPRRLASTSSTSSSTPSTSAVQPGTEAEQATSAVQPGTETEHAALDPADIARLEEEIEEAVKGLERLASEATGQEGWPANVRFEGVEIKEEVPRGLRLHTLPSAPGEPILLPLSSLASGTPTLPAPENLAVELDPEVFGLPLRRDILHRNVVWYLSTLRQGNQSSKTRATVNYSGRKLRQQKGTGRARVGDASSGTRRGGAPIFPLHPRDHAQLLPRKVRSLGLRTALSSKLSSGLLRVVQDLSEAGWEGTNEARRALCDEYPDSESWSESNEASASSESDSSLVEVIRRFGTSKGLSILFLHAPAYTPEDILRIEKFSRTIRNLPGVDVVSTDEVTVWHVLKYQWTVMEGSAVDALVGEDGEEGMDWAEGAEGTEDAEAAMGGARGEQVQPHLAA